MKTNLITRAGYEKLQKEHDYLWFERRPEVTKIVTWAASLGDRSENADYQFNKRLLRQIDRRIRYLRKRMPDLKIVDYDPQQNGKVFFGAWVEIENEEGEIKRFTFRQCLVRATFTLLEGCVQGNAFLGKPADELRYGRLRHCR